MTSFDVPRNVSQRAGGSFGVQGRVVSSAVGFYTVPAGKRARIINAQLTVNAVGSDLTYCLAIYDGVSYTKISRLVAASNIVPSVCEVTVMDAGEILTCIGDSGSTNGTCDLSASIEEFDS